MQPGRARSSITNYEEYPFNFRIAPLRENNIVQDEANVIPNDQDRDQKEKREQDCNAFK